MAAPTILGNAFARFPSNTTSFSGPSFVGVADGNWVLAVAAINNASVPTTPTGWEVVLTPHTYGTRLLVVYGKIWRTGDPTTFTLTNSISQVGSIAVVWGANGPTSLRSLVIGQALRRGEAGSSSTTDLAKSLTTTSPDTLVLAINPEYTNEVESPDSIVSATGSFTEVLYVNQGTTVNVQIDTIWIGSKVVTTPGASGDSVITHRTAAASSGMAVQIAIPSTDTPVTEHRVSASHSKYTYTNRAMLPLPRGAQDGDLIIVGVSGSASTGNPISDYAAKGWWLIDQRAVNTRAYHVFARLHSGSTPLSDYALTYAASSSTTAVAGVIRDHRVTTSADLLIGTPTPRSGALFTATAASVTTPAANYLAVAFTGEATTAVGLGWTQTTGDFTPWDESIEGTFIESAQLFYKDMPAAGATGNVVITYPNSSANGYGIQVAVPLVATTPPPTIVVPEVVTFTEGFSTAAANLSINKPTGLLAGDLLVAVLRDQVSSSTAPWSGVNAAWELVGPTFVPASTNYRMNSILVRRVSDPTSEPAAYTFNPQVMDGSRKVGQIIVLRASTGWAAVDSFYPTYGGTSSPADRGIDTFTITKPSKVLFWGASEFAGGNSHTITATPTGYTLVNYSLSSGDTAASRTVLWTGVKTADSTEAGSAYIDWAGTVAGAAAGAMSFKVIPAESLTGAGLLAANGNGAPTRVFIMKESGPRTPTALVPMRRGFNTVTEMLATPGFTWGHRGASNVMPECSLVGYVYTAARGYGVLEVSLARTSDGVWFGLHDGYLDRVATGVDGTTLDPKLMTWAQVQTYQNILGPNRAPQPFMRWEEYVEAFGKTHITVVDPKVALTSTAIRTEFLNMVQRDIGTSRAIIKGFITATTLASAASAMGFQSWGYAYENDFTGGTLAGSQGPWTTLGMEYIASTAAWDAVKSYGKPVIGHIAGNQAAYDTAMSKGAVGVQVSGTNVVAPVSWWT